MFINKQQVLIIENPNYVLINVKCALIDANFECNINGINNTCPNAFVSSIAFISNVDLFDNLMY